MRIQTSRSRSGAIAPLTALCLVGLLGVFALALDLGILMVVRNQCQNAADTAAMAGARTLTGDTTTNNNYSNAEPNANTAAAANSILGTPIVPANQVTVTIGDYYYSTTTSSFQISPSSLGQTGDNWTLVQATVTARPTSFFAQVLGITTLNASATATAAHRPRDVVIVIDFSGSMRFESLLGYSYSGNRTLSMNPSTVYPQFGFYATNTSQLTYSADQQGPSGEIISDCNTEVATANAITSVISGFYGDTTAFGTSTPAFTSASSSYATTPGGDQPLKQNKNTGSTYAYTVSDFLNSSTNPTARDWRFELDGYSAYASGVPNTNVSTATDYTNVAFNGYTQGPGYWGKTFFTWPPDPRIPLTTTYYTSTFNNYSSPGQIEQIVKQSLLDGDASPYTSPYNVYPYTAADFANTSVTTETGILSSTVTTITVPSTTATSNASTVAGTSVSSFPTTYPFSIMVGTTSSGAFTGTPEVMSVTGVSGSKSSGTTTWTVKRAQSGTSALSAVTTTPSATFSSTATSIKVNSYTGFPSSGSYDIMVGTTSSSVFTTPEIMTVTAGAGTKTWTVTRGQYGTTKVSGTTSMTVALVSSIGLVTAPPLYGTFTTSSASNVPATIGKLPSSSSAWTAWTSSTLGTYLTGNVFMPGASVTPSRELTTSDVQYQRLLRLYAHNGGAGMPKNSASTAMPCDWRARFFTYASSGSPVMDNDSTLFSSGTMNKPSSSGYLINYNAILDWIANCGPNPFPSQLRAGGIIYYTAIPTTITTSTWPPTDPNQRFWKEYIDSVLGFQQTGGSGSSPTYSDISGENGYGPDMGWGTVKTSGQPSGWPASTYITYSDNPNRPLTRHWFGPLSMVDYLGNYNAADPSNNNNSRLWWPGTVAEAPTYQTKLGVQAALVNTCQNHPNDNVGLVFFSSPRTSASATGYYNYAPAPLGKNQRSMINALWFSPQVNSSGDEISIYNSSGASTGLIYDVPRANGGTCYTMALMLAYNQFSNNSSLLSYTANAPSGTAGGLGRNGAAKLLVFETDGMVNTGASATLNSSTTGGGYYDVLVADANNYSASGTQFPTDVEGVTFSAGASQSQGIATQICNPLASGGFATTTKPVFINCIAFGSLFESTNTSSYKTNALQNLATLEVIGNVQSTGATTLATNKIIVGPYTTRISNLQAAFQSIMEDGIQVTLISSGTNLP